MSRIRQFRKRHQQHLTPSPRSEPPIYRAIFWWLIVIAVVVLVFAGCEEDASGERLADMAEKTVAMQARQNEKLLESNGHVAAGSKELVSKDAQARQELLAAQRELQVERSEIGNQRDLLELDRKVVQAQRMRDSLTAGAIQQLGYALMVSAPLALIGWLLYLAYYRIQSDPDMSTIVLEQFILENPILLPASVSPNAPQSNWPRLLAETDGGTSASSSGVAGVGSNVS